MTARFSVGIDLGTTNSVVAFTRCDDEYAETELLQIPQVVAPGQVESREFLPSFLYLPRAGEVDSLRTPLGEDPELGIVGIYARSQAAENPQRVVAASKSWLCHGKVGRTDAVLPWQSPEEVPKVSAFDCAVRYLCHIVRSWNAAHPHDKLSNQNVVLTVPASFDPAARELTREAALKSGLPTDFVLLEEPQAAVYRWLGSKGDGWRSTLSPGDTLLVVDVGGGTTDLTLVGVSELAGELSLQRLAVGNHLLIGGDNMDLALAHLVSQRLNEQGHDLDPWQSVSLWHACRDAKELLLSDAGPETQTISVLGRGSSLIGGTISTELSKSDAQDLILEGFFPACSISAVPQRQAASGFQDIGLPYESDPAITKQVAAFLTSHQASGTDGGHDSMPTHVLYNGGVFRSESLQRRMHETIKAWCDQEPAVLGGAQDLNTSVAVGGAYYGWAKQQGGIRIRGGTARSYYVGIETAGLAIPGAPRPLRALCVAARGMEEGTQVDVPGDSVGIIVGSPARFRFFSSTARPDDPVGKTLDRWSPQELVESESIELSLTSDSAGDDPFVPVRFVSRVTELGMFELWCYSTRNDDQWKMEFNVRNDDT